MVVRSACIKIIQYVYAYVISHFVKLPRKLFQRCFAKLELVVPAEGPLEVLFEASLGCFFGKSP